MDVPIIACIALLKVLHKTRTATKQKLNQEHTS